MDLGGTMPRRWARWVGTFVGFPLAGVAARAVAGDIDSGSAAIVGGLAGGAVLGAAQAWIGGIGAGARLRWVAATTLGLTVGLAAGSGLVAHRTDVSSLVAMGAISGAAVGLAQALSLSMRGSDRLLWAVATPALWAGGWFVTSQVIVDAERQHAVFGSSGAIAVSAVAAILHARRGRDGVRAAGAGSMRDRVAAR